MRIDALLAYFMRLILKIAINKCSTESIKTSTPFDIHRDSIKRFELKHKGKFFKRSNLKHEFETLLSEDDPEANRMT